MSGRKVGGRDGGMERRERGRERDKEQGRQENRLASWLTSSLFVFGFCSKHRCPCDFLVVGMIRYPHVQGHAQQKIKILKSGHFIKYEGLQFDLM